MNRLRCIVPGCNRTHAPLANGDTEWMCQKHWGSLRLDERRVYTRLRRIARKAPRETRLLRRCWRIWRYLKRRAIEKAMGI